ncbi:unnamed protein product [Cyprideis torosa]|uniref:Uncharacterized protein n=1 Tax=Cyprideis torosa TaxID=163714 RepID=A0A7R8WDS8_9CRUS|nr:unnamed protein product [Cyprideis torosa]CAG0888682.1 unnamed protein product [Cyprideis torosa]
MNEENEKGESKRRKQHTDEKQPNGRLKGSLESVVVLASSPGKKKKGGYFSSVEVKTAVIRRSSCRATQMPRSHSVPLRDGGCLSFAQKPDSDDESGGEEDTYRPAESGQPSAGGHRESRYHTFHHSTSIPLQTSSRVSYNARSGSVDFAESSNSLHRLSRIIGAQNETYHHFPSPSVESIPMPTMTSTPTCGRSSVGRSYSPGYYTTPRPPSSSSNTHSQAPTPFGRMELSNSSDNVLNESRPRGRPGVPMVTSVSRPSSLSRCPELDSVVKSRSLPHCARNRQLTLASGSLPLENTGLGITRDLRHQVMAETAAALAEATSPSYPHPMPLVGNTRILPSPSATTSSGCSSSSYAPPNKYATLSSFSGSSGSDSRHGSNATLPTSRSRQSLVAAYTGTVIVYDERTEL